MESEESKNEEGKEEEKKSKESKEVPEGKKAEQHSSHASKSNEESGALTNVMRKNPYVVSTIVLGAIILIFVVANFGAMTGRTITGGAVGVDDVGAKLLNFANQQGADAALVGVSEKSGVYEVTLEIEGREVPVYVTTYGEYLISGLTPLSRSQQASSQQSAGDYTEDDLIALGEFSSCLAEKGLVIYGANWCGWTKKLAVDTLGGFDVAGDAYVECTEEAELCEEESVEGFPTVKVNGEVYSGARTLEALAEATGCNVPQLEGSGAEASSGDASCN